MFPVLDLPRSWDHGELLHLGNRLLKELEARLTADQIKTVKASAKAQAFDQIVDKVAHLATS
jgi:hypothetical protein